MWHWIADKLALVVDPCLFPGLLLEARVDEDLRASASVPDEALEVLLDLVSRSDVAQLILFVFGQVPDLRGGQVSEHVWHIVVVHSRARGCVVSCWCPWWSPVPGPC